LAIATFPRPLAQMLHPFRPHRIEHHVTRQFLQITVALHQDRLLDYFDNFLTTLENRMDLITNPFISRSSSGWVEGLNNKIKVLKRRSYGIKNLDNPFRRIWLDLRAHEAFAH
jgi:transposase